MPPCSVIQILSWLFKSGSFSEWMDVVKVVGAAIAFGIGLWQYRSSQVWKRLEFVSAQMKIFFDDPAVRTTMQMLDWRKKKIPLFKFRDEADGEQATVDYKMVASALGTDPETRYDKKQSAIREAFERLLEYFAQFEGFIDAGAVKPTDLNPYLDYWVKLISGNNSRSPEVTREVLPSLWKFIDFYGYRDVRQFVSRYHLVAFPAHKSERS